jgi:hypothetical protein
MITDALGRDVVINFAVLVPHRIHCSNEGVGHRKTAAARRASMTCSIKTSPPYSLMFIADSSRGKFQTG